MMRTARRRMLLGVLAAAAGLGLLSGCSAPDADHVETPAATVTVSSGPTTAPPTESTPPAAATSTSTPTASASRAAQVDPNAPAGQCADSALSVTVQHDPEGDGAGQRGAFVVFRNTGSASCNLEGTPGLSLVGGGDGTQIGKPASRSTEGAKLVTIAPGDYALAAVTYTYVDAEGGNFNSGDGHQVQCRSKPADGYRVYPPHSYRASFTASKTYACSTGVRWISVDVVKPASSDTYFTPAS